MTEFWRQFAFWAVWGVVCAVVFKHFYFSHSLTKIKGLRLTSLLLDLLVLVLFFVPWFTPGTGGETGWQLLLEGHPLIIAYFVFLVASIVFFLSKIFILMKFGAVSHILASIFIFTSIFTLMPGEFYLTPVISALVLLAGNVVVVLLLHQVNTKFGKRKS